MGQYGHSCSGRGPGEAAPRNGILAISVMDAYTHTMEDDLGAALAAQREAVLAACACTGLRKATRVVTQRFDAALRPCGLRATQLSLLLACATPEPTTIARVSDMLAIDRTTLTRTLRPLSRRGLIEIGRAEDRRLRLISVTEAGHHAIATALPLWAEAENAVAEALGWEPMAQLLGGLARISAGRDDA